MVRKSDLAWTVIGLLAVVLSCYLLYKEIRTISLAELTRLGLRHRPEHLLL